MPLLPQRSHPMLALAERSVAMLSTPVARPTVWRIEGGARVGTVVEAERLYGFNTDVKARVDEIDTQDHAFDVVVGRFIGVVRDKTRCCSTPEAMAKNSAKTKAIEAEIKEYQDDCNEGGIVGSVACAKIDLLKEELANNKGVMCSPEKLKKYPCVPLNDFEKKLLTIVPFFQGWQLDWSAYKAAGVAVANSMDDYEKRLDTIRKDWVAAGGEPPVITPPTPKADEDPLGLKNAGGSFMTIVYVVGGLAALYFLMPVFAGAAGRSRAIYSSH